jgi:hypothetical protein
LRIARAALAALLVIALTPSLSLAAQTRSTGPVWTSASSASGVGFDISWPQCDLPYPLDPAFAIIGVNRGIVFSANPCLASELAWAGGPNAALYANTGNPGPELSRHWPVGQALPQICDAANPDSAGCAFDYGYNAAADSFTVAAAAFNANGSIDSPASSTWWLDVETSNSWRSDVALNVAALQGATQYLGSVGVTTIGFYSTPYQWDAITGSTGAFAANASWVAGAPDLLGALADCAGTGFTGGRVALVQYPEGPFDGNVSCGDAAAGSAGAAVGPAQD